MHADGGRICRTSSGCADSIGLRKRKGLVSLDARGLKVRESAGSAQFHNHLLLLFLL